MPATVKIELDEKAIRGGMREFTRRALSKTAYRIMRDAKSSLTTTAGPSESGTPPHTHPRMLRTAIAYAVEETSAVIGPRASLVDQAGEPEESGGEYKGEHYPKRPFMVPALQENIDFFAASFGGTPGE